jgi:hypothetical protein
MRASWPLLAVFALPAAATAQVSLGPPTAYNAGPIPEAVASHDLDGDGDVDLAVVDRQGHLRLLLNDGSGCFDQALHHERQWPSTTDGIWPGFPSLVDVAVGDLGGDGVAEVVATWGEAQGIVSVLPGTGSATFGPAVNYTPCSFVKNVAIGELDGRPGADLAVTSNCFQATVLHNDGAGAFTVGGSFGTGYTTGALALGDLDGDGDNDAAFVNIGLSSATVLFNDGDGAFSRVEGYGTGDNPNDILLADLDGDGDNDLATANFYSGDVTVRWNDGSGNLASGASFAAGGSPVGLAAGDLDGDGGPELAVADRQGRLNVLPNRSGSFAAPISLPAGGAPKAVALADLNGDGRLDAVVLNQTDETVGVYLGGGGTCPAPAAWPPNGVVVPLFAKPVVWGRQRLVFLSWGTDIRSETVTVFRNGRRLREADRGAYFWDDVTRVRGTQFTYRVCENGARFQSCSAEVAISF